ncbi:MAG: [FeFe] hydrogenase, group A, partial [Candidatus Aenigmarchaeota archaeon]|nr:[FeFe] hydrogenase, group A [Candidatus Aenigmarchaeota archaeon]
MQIKINGKNIESLPDETVLEVAIRNGIFIPHLCNDSDLFPEGNCRMCICEINGKLMSVCNTKVAQNMIVETDTQKVMQLRKMNIELLLSRHKTNHNGRYNQLIELKEEHNIDTVRFSKKSRGIELNEQNYHRMDFKKKEKTHLDNEKKTNTKDDSSPSILRDNSKCILCGKCVNKCQITQDVNAICYTGRGVDLKVGTFFNQPLAQTDCVNCGQCVLVCPSGALREVNDIEKVKTAINDPKKYVIAQTAPAIRASIGEEFGLPAGTLVTKKLVTALKKIGFDKVFDTDFGADLTIVEEASEFISRATNKGVFPMFTSCCPAWVKYIEQSYPQFIPNLSSCKSPHQMVGAIAKTYYAKKLHIDPKNIVVVSIMPCTAKKFECLRPEMNTYGFRDVDFVLTTRETARFMKSKRIDLVQMQETEYDNPLGEASGAGVIFGATGGVMEAAMRTAYEIVTGKGVSNLEFNQIRGLTGIKEGSIVMKGNEYNFAVAHGLANAKVLMDQIKTGKSKYHFIEAMACPGGCIGGGGQPMPTNNEIRQKRIDAIYREDRNLPLRKSHENPSIKKLYDEFLK